MHKHYPFPSINQFRHAIRDLKARECYVGKDDNGDPVYDWSKPLPKVEFEGRVKLHGTSAAIVYAQASDSLYCQSREQIITPEKDNAGFAGFVDQNNDVIKGLLRRWFFHYHEKGLTFDKLAIYGEWCGGNIQSNVALNKLPKHFVVFAARIIDSNEAEPEELQAWVNSDGIVAEPVNIYNISRVPTYKVEIDLDRPDMVLDTLNQMVEKIDQECPYGDSMGVVGHGEGIVFRPLGNLDYRFAFKAKGESHQKSKIRKLPVVDTEKMNAAEKLAQILTPEWRLKQALEKVCDTLNGHEPQIEQMGDLLKWTNKNILTEESDLFEQHGLTVKEVMPHVTKISKRFFVDAINSWHQVKSD